jgi:hypothetical protein
VWQARHNGQNYVFALLTGYREPPAGISVSQFMHIMLQNLVPQIHFLSPQLLLEVSQFAFCLFSLAIFGSHEYMQMSVHGEGSRMIISVFVLGVSTLTAVANNHR